MTNPCLHGGKCIDAYSGFQWSFGPLQYYCLCKPPYKGIRCEGKWQASEAASRGFYEKVVLKNFPIFTGKHLCRSLFPIKVAGLKACSIFRRGFQHSCFPVNIAKFLRTPILNIANGCFWSDKILVYMMVNASTHIPISNDRSGRYNIIACVNHPVK